MFRYFTAIIPFSYYFSHKVFRFFILHLTEWTSSTCWRIDDKRIAVFLSMGGRSAWDLIKYPMIKKYALILNVLYQFLLMKSSIFIFLSIEKFYTNTCYISNMKFQKKHLINFAKKRRDVRNLHIFRLNIVYSKRKYRLSS